MNDQNYKGNTANRGFSLVEVLVALFVLAIGVLGVVGLQVVGLQNNTDALNRTQAVLLANGILDRIRANPGAVYTIGVNEPPPQGAVDCMTTSCTPQQISDFDIVLWKCALGRFSDDGACQGFTNTPALPDGDGNIVRVNNSGIITYTVQITWNQVGFGDGGQTTPESFSIDMQL